MNNHDDFLPQPCPNIAYPINYKPPLRYHQSNPSHQSALAGTGHEARRARARPSRGGKSATASQREIITSLVTPYMLPHAASTAGETSNSQIHRSDIAIRSTYRRPGLTVSLHRPTPSHLPRYRLDRRQATRQPNVPATQLPLLAQNSARATKQRARLAARSERHKTGAGGHDGVGRDDIPSSPLVGIIPACPTAPLLQAERYHRSTIDNRTDEPGCPSSLAPRKATANHTAHKSRPPRPRATGTPFDGTTTTPVATSQSRHPLPGRAMSGYC